MWAIIGGTGFEKSDTVSVIQELDRETPFGQASSGIKRIRAGSAEALFVPRHGLHHELLPSEINYRANIFALKRDGATRVLSISAVGSLSQELKPGDIALPSQYLDRTKSLRAHTFCGDGVAGHVSLAHPVCSANIAHIGLTAAELNLRVHYAQTYLCMEGPAFSTQAESLWYPSMGAQLIGMTAYPEYALAREAGLCYSSACFITDFDCWDDSIPHVTIEEVLSVMQKNNVKAYQLIHRLLNSPLNTACACAEAGLRSGLITAREAIPERAQEWIKVICG